LNASETSFKLQGAQAWETINSAHVKAIRGHAGTGEHPRCRGEC